MHRIVPRAALCAWYSACSLASCGTTGFVRPVWLDRGFSPSTIVYFLSGISNSFASYLTDVPVVMSIAARLLLRQEDLVFDAAPEHTTSLPCLVSAVPTLHKNIQKVSARETCVSSKLQSRRDLQGGGGGGSRSLHVRHGGKQNEITRKFQKSDVICGQNGG